MADTVQLLMYLGMMNTVLFTLSSVLMLKSGLLMENQIREFGSSTKYPYHTMDGFDIFTGPPALPSKFPKYVFPPCPWNSIKFTPLLFIFSIFKSNPSELLTGVVKYAQFGYGKNISKLT